MITRRLAMVMAVAAVFFVAVAAHATEFRSAGSGDWHYRTTWEQWNGSAWVALGLLDPVPSNGDTATIQSTDTVAVAFYASILHLTVEGAVQITEATLSLVGSGATTTVADGGLLQAYDGGGFNVYFDGDGTPPVITVEDGGTLRIGPTSNDGAWMWFEAPGAELHVNGAHGVLLDPSGSNYAVLYVYGDLTISGEGSIFGSANAKALVAVNADPYTGDATTLTNAAVLEGAMTIASGWFGDTKTFDNRGRVEAKYVGSGADTILIASSVGVVTDSAGDCDHPRWMVGESGATLQFDKTATTLLGDFWVEKGTFVLTDKVQTSGYLRFGGGGTVVATGTEFNVTGGDGVGTGKHYCSDSSCSSASFPYTTTVSCP